MSGIPSLFDDELPPVKKERVKMSISQINAVSSLKRQLSDSSQATELSSNKRQMVTTEKTYVMSKISTYPYTPTWQPLPASATTTTISQNSTVSDSTINDLKDQIVSLQEMVASQCKTVSGLETCINNISAQLTSIGSPCMASPTDNTTLASANDMDISFEYLRRSVGRDIRTDTIMMLMRHQLKVGETPMGNDSKYAKHTTAVIDPSVRNSTEDKLNERFVYLRKLANKKSQEMADKLAQHFYGQSAAVCLDILPTTVGYTDPSTPTSSLHHIETEMRAITHLINEKSMASMIATKSSKQP